MAQRTGKTFQNLKQVFNRLNSPAGCPWDKKQTARSLLPSLKEEVNEFIDAVKHDDCAGMQEELGDILLHVMFQAQIAERNKQFDIYHVMNGLISKLKRRHPHVFGKTKVQSVSDVVRNWKMIKRQEKNKKRKH